jgi:hypothetical protein
MFIHKLSFDNYRFSQFIVFRGTRLLTARNENILKRRNVYKLVNYFNYINRRGLKLKTLSLLDHIFLNFHSYNLIAPTYFISTEQKEFTINNYIGSIISSISFGGFPLYIRVVQSNRKIRKYSKGKLRYRSYLAKIRSRAELGLYFRLWRISVLMNDEVANDNSYLLNSVLWFLNIEREDVNTPHTIQLAMIRKYVDNLKVK